VAIQCSHITEGGKIPHPNSVPIELSATGGKRPPSLQQRQLSVVAANALETAKNSLHLRLLATNVPHLYGRVVAARKQPELPVVLEGPDERGVRLYGFVLELVLVEELSVDGAEEETAPGVDGGSDAVFGRDGSDCLCRCLASDLVDAGDVHLQVLEGARDARGDPVLLLDVHDELLLLDELGRTALPLLHPALLHRAHLLQVTHARHLRLPQKALQLSLELAYLRLYLSQQLSRLEAQSRQRFEAGLWDFVVGQRQSAYEFAVVLLEGSLDACNGLRGGGGAGEAPDFFVMHDEKAIIGLLLLALRTAHRLQIKPLLCLHPLHFIITPIPSAEPEKLIKTHALQ